jgi:hypothetical protein
MASITIDASGSDGHLHRRVIATVTFSASYTSGGEAIAPSDFGVSDFESVVVSGGATTNGYVPRYDSGAETLQLFEENGSAGPLAEVAGGTDVSAESVQLIVQG